MMETKKIGLEIISRVLHFWKLLVSYIRGCFLKSFFVRQIQHVSETLVLHEMPSFQDVGIIGLLCQQPMRRWIRVQDKLLHRTLFFGISPG